MLNVVGDKEVVKGMLGTKIDNYLTRVTPFGFSGALLVSKNGEIFLNKGYGMAIREKGVRNTAQTVFCIGSLTKQFTAAAILKLEMQNKLNTSDCINKYFSNVPEDKKSITIHHLLTHTAGIINYTGEDYEIAYRDETVQKALNSPLLFNPGEQFLYSNAGYTLLAAIIELVSGQGYEEFLNEYLFQPAGMSFTGHYIPCWKERVVANWYVGDVNNGVKALEKEGPHWNIMGNGEMLSTTEDMYKWYVALKNDVVLSAEAKKKFFTPFRNNYAYGWGVLTTDYGTLIQHDGANDLGSSAEFRWFVNPDVLIVLLCNQSYGTIPLISVMRDKIERLVFGEEVASPPTILESYPEALTKYEGIYKLPSGGHIVISLETNALKINAKGQDAINAIFSPEQADSFYNNELNYYVEELFQAAVNGNYEYFKRELNDAERVERWRTFITSKQRELGSVEKVEVLGTFPYPRREDLSCVETVVQLKSLNRSVTFGLLWVKGKLFGMRIEEADPFFMFLKPISKHVFIGYHLNVAKNVRVDFGAEKHGLITELRIHRKDGYITAQRLSE